MASGDTVLSVSACSVGSSQLTFGPFTGDVATSAGVFEVSLASGTATFDGVSYDVSFAITGYPASDASGTPIPWTIPGKTYDVLVTEH